MPDISHHAPAGDATGTPLIRISHASKSFAQAHGGRVDAIKDVSLDIAEGDIFGLAGGSGAGKSTLLRLINVLERADSGTVTVAGREMTQLGKRELRAARQNIGMVFQQCALLHHATVYDNVAFPLRLRGTLNAPRLAARVHECLALADLADHAGSYPAQLSAGERQRTAVARALASRPAVLLYDAPTCALDADTACSLLAMLRDVNLRLGVTIVIASDEPSLLGALCKRVAVIEDGAVAEQFALADTSSPRKTALGRELAWYGVEASAAAWQGAAHV